MHPIEKYPELIAEAQVELLTLNTQSTELELLLLNITSSIDIHVAFDESLKNDTQRKARKMELCRSNGDYVDIEAKLKSLSFKLHKQQIELEKLINEFSCLKIKSREEVAFLESLAYV